MLDPVLTLDKGIYWIVFICNSTTAKIKTALRNELNIITGGTHPGFDGSPYQKAQAYGALPDTFPTGATYSNAQVASGVLKVSALL